MNITGGILTIAPLLLRFLPLWLRDLALEGFGGVDGMDSFKGRGKEWSKVDYDPM